jgi:hypothetical protein
MARELDFLIFGFPRSGTKALIRELNLHPHVYCAQERFHFGTDHSRLVFPIPFLTQALRATPRISARLTPFARALPARMCAMPATSCHVIISRSTASIARCPTSRTFGFAAAPTASFLRGTAARTNDTGGSSRLGKLACSDFSSFCAASRTVSISARTSSFSPTIRASEGRPTRYYRRSSSSALIPASMIARPSRRSSAANERSASAVATMRRRHHYRTTRRSF